MRSTLKKMFLLAVCAAVMTTQTGCKRRGGDDAGVVEREPSKTVSRDAARDGSEGVFHTVSQGESVSKIKDIYGVSIAALKKHNDISENRPLKKGQKIFVPGSPTVLNARLENYLKGPAKDSSAKPSSKKKFDWPVNGKIVSKFSPESKGIFIKTAPASPVKCVSAGEVVFSGQMKGYGNLIIVDHLDGMFSIYGNNKKNLVKKGDNVRDAQKIALAGEKDSGKLYFEIRNLNQDKGEPESVDPVKYLKPSAE